MSIDQCMSVNIFLHVFCDWKCVINVVIFFCGAVRTLRAITLLIKNLWRLRLQKLTGIYTYATNKFKTSCCYARWSYFWTITPVRHDPRGEKMKNTGTTHQFSFQCGKRKVHQSGSILLLGINHNNCWGPYAASNVYCPPPHAASNVYCRLVLTYGWRYGCDKIRLGEIDRGCTSRRHFLASPGHYKYSLVNVFLSSDNIIQDLVSINRENIHVRAIYGNPYKRKLERKAIFSAEMFAQSWIF